MSLEIKVKNGNVGLVTPPLDITQAIIEQEYKPTSENAQSGKAVAQAVDAISNKLTEVNNSLQEVKEENTKVNNSLQEIKEENTTQSKQLTTNSTKIKLLENRTQTLHLEYAESLDGYDLYVGDFTIEDLCLGFDIDAITYGLFDNGGTEHYLPLLYEGMEFSFGNVYVLYEEKNGKTYWTDKNNLNNFFTQQIADTNAAVRENTQAIEQVSEHQNYKLLYDRVAITADDIAAAGEEGIMAITIGSEEVNLTKYDDILVKIYIPRDTALNSADGILGVYATTTDAVGMADNHILLRAQSPTISNACAMTRSNNNCFVVKVNWSGESFLYGEVIKTGLDTYYGYAGAQNGWTSISPAFKKSQKRYFHICDYRQVFKLPVGSYVEVYGR